MTRDAGATLKQIVVDLGFRGVDADNPGKQIIHWGKFKSLSPQQKGWLRRRQAIEPAIGHLKSDNRMDRCWLQGALGEALHASALLTQRSQERHTALMAAHVSRERVLGSVERRLSERKSGNVQCADIELEMNFAGLTK